MRRELTDHGSQVVGGCRVMGEEEKERGAESQSDV